MNINGISNNLNGLPLMTPMRDRESEKPGEVSLPAKPVEPTNKATEGRPFYEYEKEPWLTDPTYQNLSDPEAYYRSFAHEIIKTDLFLIQRSYERFMGELSDSQPEIANKNFGFTLGEDASVKIIDYNNSLTAEEENTLSKAFNDFGLTSHLQRIARAFMEFEDHNQGSADGRSKLDLSNFRYVIDFGRILTSSFEEMGNEWRRQVEENTQRLNVSSISVFA